MSCVDRSESAVSHRSSAHPVLEAPSKEVDIRAFDLRYISRRRMSPIKLFYLTKVNQLYG